MDEETKMIAQLLFSPEFQKCTSVVESIAGYKLSDSDDEPFLYFHNYLTNSQPDFITSWRNDPKQEKWYLRFVDGISSDVHNSFACILYHYDRLIDIETAVIKGIEKFINYRDIPENSVIGIGNTLVWDFEYQAFILALRRCLDYLTKAIFTYFKRDFHSFRKLGDELKKIDWSFDTDSLIKLHDKYSTKFDFVLSDGERKSVRDKITHYGYVPVGCINLSQRGFMLVGGGEELGLMGQHGPVLLSEVLQKHVSNIRDCVREFIHAYVDSIRAYQMSGNGDTPNE